MLCSYDHTVELKLKSSYLNLHKGSEARTCTSEDVYTLHWGKQDTSDAVFMKQLSESPREAQQRINQIFNAKFITRVGTWNVRTSH